MQNELIIPANTIAVLKKHNLSLQKKFGQNFLIDAHVLDKIIEAADVCPGDSVLEIGPGIGTMTQRLAEHAGQVTAVEIDKALIPVLTDTLADRPNVRIVQGDILKTDLDDLFPDKTQVKVVANLPYYITTPVVMRLLEEGFASITVMVQKEVAERMQAGPGTKDYGALSLAVQYYASAEIVANVPPNCFIPRPNVGSAVITLTRHDKPPVSVADESRLFAVIRAAFGQRRKTLANALSNASSLGLSREDVTAALADIGIDERIRGEALTLEQFAELTNRLFSCNE